MPNLTIISVFNVGVLLNYLWELAQAPLYVGLESYNVGMFWHCFVASLGDGIMVLLIVVAGSIVLRQSDWFVSPGVRGYLVMITAGTVSAWAVGVGVVTNFVPWVCTPPGPTPPIFSISIFAI